MTAVNADQNAVRIMLSNASPAARQRALNALLHDVSISLGTVCANCGSRDIEDNGSRGYDLTFHCCACDEQWSPNAG